MIHASNRHRLFFPILLTLLLLLNPITATALEGIASFKAVTGTVDVLRNGKLPAVVVKVGDSLNEGDFVRTRSGSFAEIRFKDGTVLKVAQRSRVDIGAYFSGQQQNGANVRLPRGKVEAIVDPAQVKKAGAGRRFEVHTPNAVAGVRGTDFIVSHDRNLTGVMVRHGSVYTYNNRLPDRMITVTAGNITTIGASTPPQPPRQALPSELKQMDRGMSAPKGESSSQSTSATQGGEPSATAASQTSDAPATQDSSTPATSTQTAAPAGTSSGIASPGADAASASLPLAEALPLASSFTTTSNINTEPIKTTITPSGPGPILVLPAPPPAPPPITSTVPILPPAPTTTNVNIDITMPPTTPTPPTTTTNVNVNVNF